MQNTLQYPQGFQCCAKNIGIKDTTLDFTVIASDVPAVAAAVFTRSLFCGPAITVGRENVADGQLQAFVINSKNANVATGEQGLADVHEIARLVSEELNIPVRDILVSSTGIIGVYLPMECFRNSIPGLHHEMHAGKLERAAEAIRTTDTYTKIRSCRIGSATLVGMAKGSGMIEPDMATMLSYFVTDAALSPDLLEQKFKEAVNVSFNMVSVDTDTSTSDTVAIMANGLAGEVDPAEFGSALTAMMIDLAREIARDGEGATKLIEVTVRDASSFVQAKRVAKAIVNSPLLKSALFAGDPNWGRIAMAIGKCYEYIEIMPEKVTITIGDIPVYRGRSLGDASMSQAGEYLKNNKEITITVSLGLGDVHATVWGCDLTYDYVRINSDYSS